MKTNRSRKTENAFAALGGGSGLLLMTPKELAGAMCRSLTWIYGAKRAMRDHGIEWIDGKFPVQALLVWVRGSGYRVSKVYVKKNRR